MMFIQVQVVCNTQGTFRWFHGFPMEFGFHVDCGGNELWYRYINESMQTYKQPANKNYILWFYCIYSFSSWSTFHRRVFIPMKI